jgi:RNA-directed DNA polymerase
MTKGNSEQTTGHAARNVASPSSGLDRVREAAERDRNMRFTTLFHHINPELLEKAYYKLNQKAAVGVDGVTWKEYGHGLTEKLEDLHTRLHSGRYHAIPSKRIWLEKPDGRKRSNTALRTSACCG